MVAQELEALAADYLELERLCEAPLPKDYPPIYRLEGSYNPPQELGEEVAGAERSRLGLGDAPISDLRTILEEAVGLRVFYYPMPSPLAGVFACNDELGGCIGINSKHPSPRGNWSLAHEYGHFLTTRYQPDAVFETGGRWARTVNERFADSFASNFLMPRSGVNRRFSELKDARQEKIRVADLFQLAQFYRVSKVLAFIAAQPLDLLYVSSVTFAEIRFGIELVTDATRRAELHDWLTHKVRPMFEQRVLAVSEDIIFKWRLLDHANVEFAPDGGTDRGDMTARILGSEYLAISIVGIGSGTRMRAVGIRGGQTKVRKSGFHRFCGRQSRTTGTRLTAYGEIGSTRPFFSSSKARWIAWSRWPAARSG